jgi:hypothetical protein
MRGIARAFASLTSKLNGLETPPVGAEREKLVAAVRELAEAVSRLKIGVEVPVGVEDSEVETKKTGRGRPSASNGRARHGIHPPRVR